MSIYAVKLADWYPSGDEHHWTIKFLTSKGYSDAGIGCKHCKKIHMHWQKAYGHHSLPFGYGDIWCSKKCFVNYNKKQGRKT